MTRFHYHELSNTILNVANKVHSTLGHGLPERCYREAMLIEFKKRGIGAIKECKQRKKL